jgi:hypothetical protein
VLASFNPHVAPFEFARGAHFDALSVAGVTPSWRARSSFRPRLSLEAAKALEVALLKSPSSKLNARARNSGMHLHVNLCKAAAGVPAVQSQTENYRAKAKEFARLTVAAKSLRDGRRYRKLAEMYWALALGEEPERAQSSKMRIETSPT